MQQRPDAPTTLDAIVRFLVADLHPTVTDKALQFRVLVAANALSQCAAELRAEPGRSLDELARLRALLAPTGGPDGPETSGATAEPRTDAERRALVAALDRALAAGLRDGTVSAAADGPAMAHLTESLRATLTATNPRFDCGERVER
jgi:hypothetical protein